MRRMEKKDLLYRKNHRKWKLKKKPALIALLGLTAIVLLVTAVVVNVVVKHDIEASANVSQESMETETEAEPDEEKAGAATLPQVEETQESVQGEYPGQKKVYLTFDDGPSVNTPKILDILEEYGVKATFFTICNTRPRDIESMKRIVESGNTLAIHSVSHEYSEIYASLDSFQEDVLGMQQYLYEQTGCQTWFYRFPGGSSNQVADCSIEECREFLKEEGFTYFDWNVSSGDASGNGVPKDVIVDNVLSEIGDEEEYIVLMHDAAPKTTTVEALPEIIENLQARGYLLLPITQNTKPIHHG